MNLIKVKKVETFCVIMVTYTGSTKIVVGDVLNVMRKNVSRINLIMVKLTVKNTTTIHSIL